MEEKNLKVILEKKKRFQQDLTKVLSNYMSEDELKEVKQLIADYYAQKLIKEVDKLAEEKGWTQETYNSWLNEHMRTPLRK